MRTAVQRNESLGEAAVGTPAAQDLSQPEYQDPSMARPWSMMTATEAQAMMALHAIMNSRLCQSWRTCECKKIAMKIEMCTLILDNF